MTTILEFDTSTMSKKTKNPREISKRRHSKSVKIAQGIATTMLKYLFIIFRTYLDMVIDFVYSLFWEESRRVIPELEKKHLMLKESAVTLAKKIRNKELKSEELVQACIERIKIVNPYLNAMTDERFEEALKEAREVDQKIANGLSDKEFDKQPFLGVPFTAKESHAMVGLKHTFGIKSRATVRATYDAECVRLLKQAGAIAVAVTNVPEINKWQESRNMVFGNTSNPYHCGRTVGGSSGGEAALSAALACPISLCSDIGGSTRMPAFFCGLFGHNPTPGHTSLKGSVLRSGEEPTMAAIGFVSKHSEDLAPLTKVVADDMADKLNLDRDIDVKNLRFYYTETAKDLRVSPICSDLRKAMKKVVAKVSEFSPTTDRVPKRYYHEGFGYMFALWKHAMTKESENFAKMLANNQGEIRGLIELPKKILGKSDFTFAAIMKLLDEQVMPKVNPEWAEALTTDLKQDLIDTLGSDGVLLFPSAPAPAPYHYSAYLRPFNFAYWGIFNVAHCPSTQVPLGLNSEGIPIGIQVVAAPRQDALCLAVAKYLEKEFGGYVPPCKIQE